MKQIYYILIILFLSTYSYSTTLFQDQNVEAKNVGLNGAAMMSATGLEGIFYNPAVVNSIDKSQVLLNYSILGNDLTYFLIGAKYKGLKILGNSLAFYLRGLYSNNFEYVTSGYNSQSYFSIYEYQGGINYSSSKLKKVLFGINFNFGCENYFIYNNKYLSFDSAVVVKISKSFDIVWVGKNIELYSINSDLNAVHNVGIRYNININNNKFRIFPVFKISKIYIEKVIGLEYNYNEIFQIYTGLKFNPYSYSSISDYINGGISIGYKFIKISYGFKSSTVPGNMHSFSMIYTF